MKIGIDARFLTHPQPGGFKTYTTNLIDELSQIDHENQYFVYTDREPSDKDHFPQQDNFIYRILPVKLPIIGMPIREQFSLVSQVAKDNCDIVHYLCNTAPTRIHKKSVLSLLDVIQVNEPQDLLTVNNVENFRRWLITNYSKWTILRTAHRVNKVLTLSEYEKKEIEKTLNIPSDRIHVTYMAVSDLFSPADPQTKNIWRTEISNKYGIDTKFILGVGYERRKNIPLLIEAYSGLVDKHLELSLVIVAAEPEKRTHFLQYSKNLGIENKVKILPSVQHSELVKLYNLAEVFVFPSERESFGAPPLEAMACGTPTVAMSLTSLPEIIGDGGVLVSGKNVSEWTRIIDKVYSDENTRNNLIPKGLQQVQKFTWRKCAENTLEVYKSIANGLV